MPRNTIFADNSFINKTSQSMKKVILAAASLLFPIFLSGQTKASIGGMIGVDYTYRVIKSFPIFDAETPKIGYRIGGNYHRKLTGKVWLESGLRLAFQGYNGPKLKNRTWGSEFNPTTGVYTRDPSLPHEVQNIYDYLFLEIPIGIRYELAEKKLKKYIAFSLSPNVYLTTKVKTITDLFTKEDFQQTYGVNKVTVSANIGFGFEYSINDRFQAFAQPSFRFHFTKFGNGLVGEYLYNGGVELGFRKNLK
jgi:hypothetical protein